MDKRTVSRLLGRGHPLRPRLLFFAALVVFCGCDAGATRNPADLGGKDGALLFQFVQLSDLHLGKGSPQPEENLRHAVSQIREMAVAFVLLTGDLTDHGRTEEYEVLETILSDLLVPWYAVPGDNDILDGEGDLERFLEEVGPAHLSFDIQGWRFLGLNNVLDPALDEEQRQWLEAELAGDPSDIVFAHKALLDRDDGFEPYPNVLPLLDLLEENGVILFLNGDVHESALVTRGGVHHVWCDNLNQAHTGVETYNLYKIYSDAIEILHVFADGSTSLAERFFLVSR